MSTVLKTRYDTRRGTKAERKALTKEYDRLVTETATKKDDSKVDSAWLLAQLKEYTTRMVETAAKKNADYAGASVAPFANFSHVETLGIATTEQGFLTRMTDKLCRVATFAKKGVLQVSDESVEDTLLDLSNYALLMAAYIKAKKAGML